MQTTTTEILTLCIFSCVRHKVKFFWSTGEILAQFSSRLIGDSHGDSMSQTSMYECIVLVTEPRLLKQQKNSKT